MAKICEGMSGREISKMGVAWQAAVYASEDGVLTEKMVLDRCHAAIHQHKQKVISHTRISLETRKTNDDRFYFRWLGYQNKRNWTINQSLVERK